MERLSLTPARRQPIPAGQMPADAPSRPLPRVPKWGLLRRLTTARRAFGLSDRALSVLNALLTFYPENELGGSGPLVVFPSNATLSARAHGMPESTLRRHLAALVGAGLLWRHDSPNGKRYARRDRDGQLLRAFGFDLTPLVRRADEIDAAAEEAQREAEALHQMREECVLLLRDVTALAEMAPPLDEERHAQRREVLRHAQRLLRRKLGRDDLEDLHASLDAHRDALLPQLPAGTDHHVSGDDAQNERHNQKSEPDSLDESVAVIADTRQTNCPVPLDAIRSACPDVESLAPGATQRWRDFIETMRALGSMLGIGSDLWNAGMSAMGATDTATTVACLVQRASEIRSPGAYFRTLVGKARQGTFSPRPMLASLHAKRPSTAA